MPKVKPFICTDVPAPNYLRELVLRYMRAQHLTLADVGAKMNCTGQNISKKLSRPSDAWSVKELKEISFVVGIPIQLTMESVSK